MIRLTKDQARDILVKHYAKKHTQKRAQSLTAFAEKNFSLEWAIREILLMNAEIADDKALEET